MTSARIALFAAVVSAPAADATHANPIRKVVTLMQKMEKKVIAEGEGAKALYDKFICGCKASSGDLSASIAAANEKLPQVASNIKKLEEEKTQNKEDLEGAKTDRIEAKKAIAEATEMRKQEAASFAGTKAEYEANLAALSKAIASLEKGMSGSAFLQTSGAHKVQQLAQDSKKLFEDDRVKLLSFLSGQEESEEETPGSGEITGIMKQLGDEMTASLNDATATESAAISAYDKLVATRTKELGALQKAIEERLKRNGEFGIEIAQAKNDETDTEEALAADQKALAGVEARCAEKTAAFEEEGKTRGQELEALADTIKMLNSDEALELFKKTLPSSAASLLQVQVSASAMRARALAALSKIPRGPRRASFDFLALAMRGKTTGFEKVVQMIDGMVATLKQEQKHDDNKLEECKVKLDQADDSRKALERTKSDEEKAIATVEDSLATTAQEIRDLKSGLRKLDSSVAAATKQRQDENVAFKELMQSNGAAKELITMAKKRMNKFYNPGVALGQVAKSAQRKQQSSGVLDMMDTLIRDLDKEMTEAQAEEKFAQTAYETMMSDSKVKRQADAKSLTEKEATSAEFEEALESHTEAKNDATKELMATMQFIQAMHLECDFLMKHYDDRKEAREGELDAMGKAKDVLSGSDYSFLQTRSRRSLRAR